MPTDLGQLNDPPTDAEKEKPVLVYIYGPDISYPSYEDLVEIKLASEKNGQPFLLIPEPVQDETGNYAPSIAPVNNSINDIKNSLDTYFENGGIYSNREFTTIINVHGGVNNQADIVHSNAELQTIKELTKSAKNGEHVYVLGLSEESTNITTEMGYIPMGRSVDSTELFDALLQYKDQLDGLCIGIFDASCYSGASIVDLAESINSKGGIGEQNIHFFSVAEFNEAGWQDDTLAFVQAIPEMTSHQLPLTTENLKKVFMEVAGDNREGVDPSVTEKIFTSKKSINLNAISYENFEQKMDYVMANFTDVKAEYSDDPRFSEFLEFVENYADTDNLSTEFIKQDLSRIQFGEALEMNYPKLLWFSDEIYDDIQTKAGNSVDNAQLSDEMLRMYAGNFSELNSLSSEDKLAHMAELADDGKVLLDNYGQWNQSLNDAEMSVVLRAIAERSPEALLKNQEWKSDVSPETLQQVMENAVVNTTDSFPELLISNKNWQGYFSPEDTEVLHNIAIENLTRLKPEYILENKVDLEQTVSQEIIAISLTNSANQIPHGFAYVYPKWDEAITSEQSDQILNTFVQSYKDLQTSNSQVTDSMIAQSVEYLVQSIDDPKRQEVVKIILDKALDSQGIDAELHKQLKSGLEGIQLDGIQQLDAIDSTPFENITPTPFEQKSSPENKNPVKEY